MAEEEQEEDGSDQDDGRVEETFVDDGRWLSRLKEDSLDEPGSSETDENIEDVAADGVTDGHVAQALLHHGDAGQGVLDTDSGRHQGEAHDGVRDCEGEPCNTMVRYDMIRCRLEIWCQ